jgi:hypothetical protein
MAAPGKAEVTRELEEAWQALRPAVESFSADELERPGVVERWSMKDLLGHIAFWAQEATKNLRLIAFGHADDIRRPGGERTAAEWNEREYRLRKDRPLAAVRGEWLGSHEDAKRALESFPANMLGNEVRGRPVAELFAEDTYGHYREHLAHIHAWRATLDEP